MSQEGRFSWGSTVLRRWLMEGGVVERPSQLTSLPRAMLFDACLSLQNALPTSAPLASPPLFIMGLWRSGTTLLHEMLSGIDGFLAPTTQQCFRPATFRLAPQQPQTAGVRRPMDDVIVSDASPQEDEFALLLLGVSSLYQGVLDPRRLGTLQRLLIDDGDAAWQAPWDRFLRSVAMGATDRLVIKSPNHLFRAASIRARFPESPFVAIVRDARQLYFSNIRTWNALIDLHGLWPAPPNAVEAFVIASLEAGAEALERLAVARGEGLRLAVCHFDALTAQPAEVCSRMLTEIGLPPSTLQQAQLARLAGRKADIRPQTTLASLPTDARQAIARLEAASARLLGQS
jgi:omega-hydroxy-beta-dihydromenaquinone-9 sulfotransferase